MITQTRPTLVHLLVNIMDSTSFPRGANIPHRTAGELEDRPHEGGLILGPLRLIVSLS